MNERERIEMLEKSLQRHLDWIVAANSRINLSLTVSITMLGVLAALLPQPLSAISCWPAVFTIASGFLLTLSLIFLWKAVLPRFDGPERSTIYFKKAAELRPEEYASVVTTMANSDYIDDLAGQCHVNASIADLKFRYLKRSMKLILVGFAAWLPAVYLLFESAPKG